LTIADDGAGFDVDTAWGTGLGLVSMSERIESVGGTLKVQSAPRAGTRLEVTVPLSPSPASTVAV
jgi:signal transduction histidine kinase